MRAPCVGAENSLSGAALVQTGEVASLDGRVVHTIYAQLDARAHEAP
jgi:hypothetical protein